MRRCALHKGVVSAMGLLVGNLFAASAVFADVVPSDTLGTAVVVTHRPGAAWRSTTPAFTLDTLALRQRGVTDVGDALRRLPGVNLRDYGGAGGLKTVSVRGLGAAHTAVSFDGMPMSDVRSGQVDFSRFTLENLSGVGVAMADHAPLLAPVSALAAAQIVVQSVSPDTAATHRHVGLTHGAFGTVEPYFNVSSPLGHGSALSLGGDFHYGRNDYPFTVFNGVATHREKRRGSRMQAWTGEANFVKHLNDGRLTAKAYYQNTHRRLPGIVTLYTADNHERLAEQTALAQAMWRQQFGGFELMGGGKFEWASSHYQDIDGQYPGGRLEQQYYRREWFVTTGVAYAFGPFKAAYAVDLARRTMNSNQQTDGHVGRTSLLQALSLNYTLGRLTATGRLAAHLHHDNNTAADRLTDTRRLTPMVSLAFAAIDKPRSHVSLRTFYQELYRVPTFTEAYYYHLGNQTLHPELTRQVGIGAVCRLDRPAPWLTSLVFTADGWFNRVRDRIVSIPYNLYVWRTMNVGKTVARGLDLTLEARLQPAAGWQLVVAANHTIQAVEDRTLPGTIGYGCQAAYTPMHSGAASLACETPWVSLSVHTTYASERWSTNDHTPTTRLPGYAEAGVALYHRFNLGKVCLDLRADLVNAFDKQYAVVRRYPMPGRAYKLSVKVYW